MHFPKISTATRADKARTAVMIVDYARQVQEWCDQIRAEQPSGLDLKKFNALIHSARLLRAELDGVAASGEIGAFARSVRSHLEDKIGRDFTQADVNAQLAELKAGVDSFVPAAIAAQPVDAETGALILYRRNAGSQDIEPVVLTPAPGGIATLVTALRAVMEG